MFWTNCYNQYANIYDNTIADRENLDLSENLKEKKFRTIKYLLGQHCESKILTVQIYNKNTIINLKNSFVIKNVVYLKRINFKVNIANKYLTNKAKH